MEIAFKNRNDEELNLILSKIYLYLAYHYMDLHYYERAIDFAERCRYLFIEKEQSSTTILEVNKKKINEYLFYYKHNIFIFCY